jgi:predicted PurR-regulated permease PerM
MSTQPDASQQAVEAAIRLGTIALIVYLCFLIFEPFMLPVAWAIIIAVAVYPLHLRLVAVLGGRSRLALAAFTLVGVAVLIVPTAMLTASVVEGVQAAHEAYESGGFEVPPPPPEVAELPIVGERLSALWAQASSNLTDTLAQYGSEILGFLGSLVGAAAGVGATVLQFLVSILIAAVLMANAEGGERLALALGRRLAGEQGAEFAVLATATTRSVAQGVLGVAFIQAVLGGMGMLAVGVPAAGLWGLLVLVLAVVQLPPLLVLGPVAVYVFTASETVPAVLFGIWAVVVSASDTFLKPLLLGRGLDVPMLVILVGAIGGMILAGLIGLFVGAVTLALAYRIFMAWLGEEPLASEGS